VSESAPKSVPEVAAELWAMTKDYVRQETIAPLKDLGRYIGFGLGGALLGGFGVFMLLMAALRALQTQTGDAFGGRWTWVPYVIVIVIGGLLITIAVLQINRNRKRNR
jgi:hypothetical protein